MKVQKNCENDKLKELSVHCKEAYKDILHTTLNTYLQDDDEYTNKQEILKRVNNLSDLDKQLLFMYAVSGATKSAELLCISREYMHQLVRKINGKIKQ